MRTYKNDIVKKYEMYKKKRVKAEESGTKKPNISYGIGHSKPECGEKERIQQGKKKYRIGKTREYITNKTHFPANFCSLGRL